MSELPQPLRAALRDAATPARVESVWQRVQARRNAGPARGLQLRAAWSVVLACALLAGAWWLGARAPVLRVVTLQDGAALATLSVGASEPARVVPLSDGTRVTLSPGTQLRAGSMTSQQTELVLERGKARFEVAKQGARRFEVIAGEARVQVIGTVFTVDLAGAAPEISVEHGRVRVQAFERSWLLGAGQRVLAEPLLAAADVGSNAGTPTADAVAPPAGDADAVTPPAGDAKAANGPMGAADARPAVATAPPAKPTPATFRQQLARAASATALLALADQARAAARPEDAELALQRLLQRHPRDASAPLAALALGRIQQEQLHRPAAAAKTLRAALAAGVPLALREDAEMQLLRAYVAADARASAAETAARYLKQYPNGRYVGEAKRWLEAR
jgi:TolA-binding protein